MLNLIETKHFIERYRERNIPKKYLKSTLKTGDVDFDEARENICIFYKKFQNYFVHVVVDVTTNTLLTAYKSRVKEKNII